MEQIINKLNVIKETLGLSQKELAERTGTNQGDVSVLLKGGKKFLHIRFLQFLNDRGFSLQALFDNSISVEEFRKIGTNGTATKPGAVCVECERKDMEIKFLREKVEDRDMVIDLLKGGNGSNIRSPKKTG